MLEQISTYLPYAPYAYLGLISLIAIIVTLYDKAVAGYSYRVSPKGSRGGPKLRTPEAKLFYIALLGGSIAMLITMLLCRHKTRKLKFMLGLPAIILLQIAAVVAVFVLL